MENNTKNLFSKAILVLMTFGIWAIVLQNAGIIPTNQNVKVVNTVDTYVKGGQLEAEVSGSVSVDNEVDINISSVNGYESKSYGNGHLGVSTY